MTTSLNTLCTLRSRHAEEIKGYLARVIEVADRTLWSRQGTPVRPTDIAIPIRTIVEDRSLDKDRQEQDEQEKRLREKIDAYKLTDPNRAKLLEFELSDKKRKFARWDQELFRSGKVLVKSGPGGGKSFLTAISAIRLADRGLKDFDEKRIPVDAYHLPILIELPKWVDQCSKEDPSAAFFEYLQQTYGMSEMLWDKIQARLGLERKDGHSPGSRNAWFILDSLDQVPSYHREKLKGWLELLEHQPNVIVTCRTVQYQPDFLPYGTHEKYKSVELAPFRRQETRRFVSKWFEKETTKGESLNEILQSGGNLDEMARTPFLLTLCCLAHGERALASDIRKVELFGRFLPDLIRGAYSTKIKKKWEADDPKIYEELSSLVRIARYLYERNRSGNLFSLSGLKRALKKAGVPESDQTAKIKWMLKRDLIVFAGHTQGDRKQIQYSFPHRSILEYLAARGIYEESIEQDPGEPAQGIPPEEDWSNVLTELDARSWDPNFWEIICYLSGIAYDPWPMLERIADPMQDDAMGYRQSLALRAMGEVRKEWRELKQGDFERIGKSLIDGPVAFFGEDYISKEFEYLIGAFKSLLDQLEYRQFSKLTKWNFQVWPKIYRLMKSKKANKDLFTIINNSLIPYWLRMSAVSALQASNSEREELLLIENVQNTNSELRRDCIEALEGIASEKAVACLVQVLREPGNDVGLLKEAARILGELKADNAVESLLEKVYDSDDDSVRYEAADALLKIDLEIKVDTLIKILDRWKDDLNLYYILIELIAKQGLKKAEKHLVKLLMDSMHHSLSSFPEYPIEIVKFTAQRLRELGSEAVVDICIQKVNDPKENLRVRRIAVNILGELGSELAVAPLIKLIIEEQKNPNMLWLRMNAVEALGELGSITPVKLIMTIGNSKTESLSIRLEAARSLSKIKPDVAVPVLIALLLNVDNFIIQRESAKLLGNCGSVLAVDALISVVDNLDADLSLRLSAAEALGKIGATSAVQSICRMIVNNKYKFNQWEIRILLDALVKIGSMEVVTQLTQILETHNPFEICNSYKFLNMIVESLGIISYETAIPAMLKAFSQMRNDDYNSHFDIIKSLGQIGSVHSLKCLFNMMFNPQTLELRYPEFYDEEFCAAIIKIANSGVRFRFHSDNQISISTTHELVERFLAGHGWPDSSKD
jgi:HEAT repeat protein